MDGKREVRYHCTDWATAVVDEGDTCQLNVSFTYHSSGPRGVGKGELY